ncbi:MAG: hypothetical protein V4713_00740 [Pseudomonadota bacterium]
MTHKFVTSLLTQSGMSRNGCAVSLVRLLASQWFAGGQGRTIAEHRCIKEKTAEKLFSLKEVLQK